MRWSGRHFSLRSAKIAEIAAAGVVSNAEEVGQLDHDEVTGVDAEVDEDRMFGVDEDFDLGASARGDIHGNDAGLVRAGDAVTSDQPGTYLQGGSMTGQPEARVEVRERRCIGAPLRSPVVFALHGDGGAGGGAVGVVGLVGSSPLAVRMSPPGSGSGEGGCSEPP